MEVIILTGVCIPRMSDCIMRKNVLNKAYNVMSVLAFLAITLVSIKFYIDLKAISCRIAWSLFRFIAMRVICYHKAATVVFQLQRVKIDLLSILLKLFVILIMNPLLWFMISGNALLFALICLNI